MDISALGMLGLGLLLGLVVGGVVGALAVRAKVAGSTAEARTLRTDRAAIRAELEQLRGALTAAQERAASARSQATAAETALRHERSAAAETEQRLREAFGTIAADALRTNNDAFLQLAEQRLQQANQAASGDLAQRQQAIKSLVDPLQQALRQFDEHTRELEKARGTAYAGIKEQVSQVAKTNEGLRTETSQLVSALRSPQVRGRWGELQLRRIVEYAGMLEHVDFDEQHTVRTEDGAQRPDMVIRLAGGKTVVVDSKVPYEAFLAAESAPDDQRAARLAEHAKAVREHVKTLSKKAYWSSFATAPEFVVMFMPGETLLSAAWESDPGLVEFAVERNVVIATPTTLIALLRTVAYAWKQDALAENAQQVQLLAKDLYSRLATMGGHVGKLGTALGSAVKAYNESVGSLEGRVLVTARKLAELKVSDTELPEPAQIERYPRQLAAAELVASANEQLVAFDEAELRAIAELANPGRGKDRGNRDRDNRDRDNRDRDIRDRSGNDRTGTDGAGLEFPDTD